MSPFKPGDIVKQRVIGSSNRFEFFHVETVHSYGGIDAIADDTGKPCGLSSYHSRLELASMAELLADRARRAGA